MIFRMLNIQQNKDDFEEQNVPANLKQLKKLNLEEEIKQS